jgi:alkylation response protein AidB-like acyl-CoA dehydrogenase
VANYFKDNADLQYYFERGIDWDSLLELGERKFGEDEAFTSPGDALDFFRDIAEMVGEFVAEEIAPHAAAIDREGVKLVDGEVVFPAELDSIFEKIRKLDLHSLCLPRELGGMNAPVLLYLINSEVMGRADISTMAHHGFHGGMAMAMLMFSLQEGTTVVNPESMEIESTRFLSELQEIAAGKAWGCMDITEPDAGSDMAALRCAAAQDADGQWRVTGQKIFITSGHGKYHFVIARTEESKNAADPLAGLAGLSLFLVPAYQDGPDGRVRLATVSRTEEKLGHHGSATCTIDFDETPAHLIGKPGEGFRFMLFLMNNARLGVGFECLGLCEAAYRLAKDYAAQRPSMGKTIDKHEMIADMLDEMESDIEGIRALAMEGAVQEEVGQKKGLALRFASDQISKRRVEGEIREHKIRARRVTPLLKYLGAEKAVEMARRCVQIHGGNGYMKEFGAEKLLRDATVMPIYEGTSQIQSLMAMKDCLAGIMKDPPAFLKRSAQTRWRALSARDPLERRVAKLSQLSLATQQHLMTRTATNKLRSLQGSSIASWPKAMTRNWDPKRDFGFAMLHAERLTGILADEAICELLLAQAAEHPERRVVLERYLERAEPRCRYRHDQICSTGSRLLKDLRRQDGAESSLA